MSNSPDAPLSTAAIRHRFYTKWKTEKDQLLAERQRLASESEAARQRELQLKSEASRCKVHEWQERKEREMRQKTLNRLSHQRSKADKERQRAEEKRAINQMAFEAWLCRKEDTRAQHNGVSSLPEMQNPNFLTN
ncbi:MAG: hypothetical protein MHMPM18_002900 [Marteilia pararefringens]